MPAALRCPHCGKAYRIEKSIDDRTFKCRKCGGIIEFRGRPDEPEPEPEAPPKRRWNFRELPGWAAVGLIGAVVGGVAYLAYAGVRGPGEPHDQLYEALDDRYAEITALVSGVDSAEDAAEARRELVALTAEINRLLADPRPFGRSKKPVGAAAWKNHGPALTARLERLRDVKTQKFDLQGVGGAISSGLRELPQTEPDLRRRLTGG